MVFNVGIGFDKPHEIYYVFNHDNNVSDGPYNYQTANAQARHLSKDNTSGRSSVLTLTGPTNTPGKPFVVGCYVRGRLLTGGRASQCKEAVEVILNDYFIFRDDHTVVFRTTDDTVLKR